MLHLISRTKLFRKEISQQSRRINGSSQFESIALCNREKTSLISVKQLEIIPDPWLKNYSSENKQAHCRVTVKI
ncbi:unnamed protein product [Blumeria hordei]|uniref:Uncharacterized protein n=1 Tax=Blumeria hordei TaxID=2867405 RepID=A0A383UYW6_BLUHO|nr:unnamed protein product [Blumeria hordei]